MVRRSALESSIDEALNAETPHAVTPFKQSFPDPQNRFKLQAVMRRGTGSSIRATWPTYATIEEARAAAESALRDDRVLRFALVTDCAPPRFVEWANR